VPALLYPLAPVFDVILGGKVVAKYVGWGGRGGAGQGGAG